MSDVIFDTVANLNGEALDINLEYNINSLQGGAGNLVSDFTLTGAYYYDDDANLIQLRDNDLQQIKAQCDTEDNRIYAYEQWNR